MSNVDSIKIRMYNTGSVGDCLFLQFRKNDKTTFKLLIDCGGYHTNAQAITKCAEDIKKELNGEPLDLVVVTHEHLDHVSGFNQAKAVFDTIDFNQVWMAWTEDKTDSLARKLKRELGKKIAALTKALTDSHMQIGKRVAAAPKGSGLRKKLERYERNWAQTLEALRFENGLDATSSLTVSQAMTYVQKKSKSKAKDKMFRHPGEVISNLKGAEGIKFYILGPPYDQDLGGIRNKIQEDEVYSLGKHLSFATREAFLNAVDKSAATRVDYSPSPFNKKYRLNKNETKAFLKSYDDPDMKWRQIEEDWMEASGDVGAAVNSYTNNTSLAMAIEISGSGKVLLFPADAQSGNWLSWHNAPVMKDLKANGGRNTDELLDKTVFYKVGHHGSHNGTASVSGLDKINGKPLVAMMPLVQDKVPSQWGGSKNFPAKALYTALIKKTNGAIIRTDEGLIKDNRAVSLRNQNLSADMKNKLANAGNNQLYREWTVD